MKAAPVEQLRLLDVQSLDTTLDQLAHRRAHLPEIAEIAELGKRLEALAADLVRVQAEDGDLGREQTRLENEVDMVRSRAARDQQRLDSGAVGSPRELENLQHEIASLGRRQAELEDQVLELMERRESVDGRRQALLDEQGELTKHRDAAVARRDQVFAEIDSKTADVRAERAQLAGELPSELMGLYEKIRASSGGVGAAALHRGQCQGCHLALSGQDLGAMRTAAEDEVVRCEECRRILIRAPESGL